MDSYPVHSLIFGGTNNMRKNVAERNRQRKGKMVQSHHGAATVSEECFRNLPLSWNVIRASVFVNRPENSSCD